MMKDKLFITNCQHLEDKVKFEYKKGIDAGNLRIGDFYMYFDYNYVKNNIHELRKFADFIFSVGEDADQFSPSDDMFCFNCDGYQKVVDCFGKSPTEYKSIKYCAKCGIVLDHGGGEEI